MMKTPDGVGYKELEAQTWSELGPSGGGPGPGGLQHLQMNLSLIQREAGQRESEWTCSQPRWWAWPIAAEGEGHRCLRTQWWTPGVITGGVRRVE